MAVRWPEQKEQKDDGKKETSSKLVGFEELPPILRSETLFLESFPPIAAKASRSTLKTFYS